MIYEDNDIYYIVKVRENIPDALFYKTTVFHKFCGKLVNQTGSNFYFELNGSNALVIIPHSWVEWMAPSTILWFLKEKKQDDSTQEMRYI